MTSRIYPSSVSCHGFALHRKGSSFSPSIFFLMLLFYFLSLSNAQGEIIEIPLPEFVGIYTIDNPSAPTVSFDLGHPVAEVHQALIQWSGTITPGTLASMRPYDLPIPWPCQVCAFMNTSGDGHWSARFGPVEGSFRDTTAFEDICDPTWDFLNDGVGDLTAGLVPEPFPGIYLIVESPILQLDSVSIIFDVDLATGVANTATWGEIKARYRKNSAVP